jgi:hypothetical protein
VCGSTNRERPADDGADGLMLVVHLPAGEHEVSERS